MEELIKELKQELVKSLNLVEINPENLSDNTMLFGKEGLGLDSIDALELIVLMDRKYGIKIQDPKQGREIFTTIENMADFINKNRTK